MRTCALLLAAAVAAAEIASTCCRPAQTVTSTPPPTTTVAGICQAAHDADSRVSATFCSTLLKGTDPSADACILADSAAAKGVSNTIAAKRDIAKAVTRSDDQGDDPIYRSVLVRCDEFYSIIREKYDAAREAIADQKYGDVEEELSSVSSRGQSCDDEFAALDRREGASPFVKYSEDNTQIALLTVAITSLIKQ